MSWKTKMRFRMWSSAAMVVAGVVWMCVAAYTRDGVVGIIAAALITLGLILAYSVEEE
jgi:hypothetical protein